jgi:uncharacterized membrane protein YsdA (DUF1294 family)
VPTGLDAHLNISARAWVIVGSYAVASLITFIAFALDKRAAERDRWRTPERTLHGLEFLGGWPGALLAIFTLRHKSSKGSFLIVTFLIAAVHIGAWVWLALSRSR